MVEQASLRVAGESGGVQAISPVQAWPETPANAPPRGAISSALNAALGALATAASLLLGVALVLVFAAMLALMFVLTAALAASGAFAWRLKRLGGAGAGRRPRRQRIGHSWIAYAQT